MLRGLRKAWKFPLMFDFDWNMTLADMKEIITVIEECGGRVRSCTGDMGNKTFLSDVGVCKGIYSFPNPVRPEARVHVFCDAPHLIKVLLLSVKFNFLLLFPFSSCEIILSTQGCNSSQGSMGWSPSIFRTLKNCGTMIQVMVMSQNITNWAKITCIAKVLVARELGSLYSCFLGLWPMVLS